jgi:copper homeostasis protein CutC
MKNSTVKRNPKDKIEAIVDALLESDQMESTARYLTSGRRFANLETEEIKERWTRAAQAFLISYGGVNPREMDDLSSELGLRKVALPCEEVGAETAAVARRIGRDDNPQGHARIRGRIHKFRDDLESPRN